MKAESRIYTDRDTWAAAVTAACAPYSWHTRSSGDGLTHAVSGDKFIGYWQDSKNQGFINDI